MTDEAPPDAGGEPTKPNIAVAMLVQFAIFVVGGVALWTMSGRRAEDLLRFDAAEILGGIAMAGALIAAFAALCTIFPRFRDTIVDWQRDSFDFLGSWPGWPLIALISFCAGVGEELLFRVGLQTYLAGWIGVYAAIGVASAAFALMHLAKPPLAAMIFAIGVVFGTVYHLTGSFVIVAIGHALYDLWALPYLLRELRRTGASETEPALANSAGDA